MHSRAVLGQEVRVTMSTRGRMFGYSEYRDGSSHGVLGVLTLLPAQRCAVVAAAPPAGPLQRRYRPRSARAVCAAPGSVPATARCRSIAASLCACSASPAGARRCASAACASATIQRCAQPLRSHRPRTSTRARAHGAAQHRRSIALRCTAQDAALADRLASAHCTHSLWLFASAVRVARYYRPRVRLRCGRPDRRHSRASRVRVHAFACARSPRSRPPRRKLQVRRHHRSRRRRPKRGMTRAHRRILQV